MNVIYERLVKPTDRDLKQIQHLYETSFPPTERKPFAHFPPRLESGDYLCILARHNNESRQILAFALLMLLPNTSLAFLEYVAVDKETRGQGVGSSLLRAVVDYLRELGLAQGMVWEVEPPTDNSENEQNRRIRFYERLGAKMIALSTPYVMPNYLSGQGGVPLHLMQLPLEKQPDVVEVSAIVQGIYRVAYPDWGNLRDEVLQGLAELPS